MLKKLVISELSVLFDTDGYLKFSKQTKNMNYYPRIRFCFRDSNFVWQVKELLEKINFNFGTWTDNRYNKIIYFEISGKDNLGRWMKVVNSSNLVHKTKYLMWKKFGFHKPKSSLKSRIEALNLNIE